MPWKQPWKESMPHQPGDECAVCGCVKELRARGQWWILSGYYGLWGTFCPCCFELAAHDPYKNPRNPSGYRFVQERLGYRAMYDRLVTCYPRGRR